MTSKHLTLHDAIYVEGVQQRELLVPPNPRRQRNLRQHDPQDVKNDIHIRDKAEDLRQGFAAW